MYTEYVFENKKYEVAARDIKATLFDIVSTEEGKISDLREKAFIETNDPKVAKDLQNLYVQQDGLLREILAASDNLYKTLEKVDTCSRKLKQIENKNLAEIVATIHGDVNQMSQKAVQEQVTQQVEQQQVAEAASTQPVVAEEAQPLVVEEAQVAQNTEQVVQDEGDSLAANTATDATYGEGDKVFADDRNNVYMEGDDFVLVPNGMSADGKAPEGAQPQQADAVEQTNKTATQTNEEVVVENNGETTKSNSPTDATYGEENKVFADDRNNVYMEGDDFVLVPNGMPADGKAPEEAQQAGAEVQTSEKVEEPEMINTEEVTTEPVMVPDTGAVEEPVMTPVIEEVADSNAALVVPAENVVPSTSGPLITPVIETQQVAEAQPVIEAQASEPVIQPSQEAAPGLPLPVISEESTQVINTDVVPSLTLKKRTADQPKVIMISGIQASKLRASLETQEALLSAKGMFQNPTETVTDATLEQQLVNNGLLEADASAKQAQIEQMMEQANALYSAGRVEEAQNMYNQISALNKELQGESAGLAK